MKDDISKTENCLFRCKRGWSWVAGTYGRTYSVEGGGFNYGELTKPLMRQMSTSLAWASANDWGSIRRLVNGLVGGWYALDCHQLSLGIVRGMDMSLLYFAVDALCNEETGVRVAA